MGSGRTQCALLEATLGFVREFKLASEVELPQDPLPAETGWTQAKRKMKSNKTFTVEEMRRESFNQDPFIPEFLYEAMKENKRFDSMQVYSQFFAGGSRQVLTESSLERPPGGCRRVLRILPGHVTRGTYFRN